MVGGQPAPNSVSSPLADESPDLDVDAVYLPGGYPELHAGALAANRTFVEGVRAAAHRGAFVYGECGGFMALGERLIDRQGQSHAMADLLPIVSSFAEPRLHLGYRRMRLLARSPLGQPGPAIAATNSTTRSWSSRATPRACSRLPMRAIDRSAKPAQVGNVCGSFLHLIDRTPKPATMPADRLTCAWSAHNGRSARAHHGLAAWTFRRARGALEALSS